MGAALSSAAQFCLARGGLTREAPWLPDFGPQLPEGKGKESRRESRGSREDFALDKL